MASIGDERVAVGRVDGDLLRETEGLAPAPRDGPHERLRPDRCGRDDGQRMRREHRTGAERTRHPGFSHPDLRATSTSQLRPPQDPCSTKRSVVQRPVKWLSKDLP